MMLKLPQDDPIVLFGAMGGERDPRKGFDLLEATLKCLNGDMPGLRLLVLGSGEPDGVEGGYLVVGITSEE